MPRFLAVYTMKPEELAAFRAQAKSEQEAADKLGVEAWLQRKEWGERNAGAIVAIDAKVEKTKRVTESGIARCAEPDRRLSDRRSRRHRRRCRPLP